MIILFHSSFNGLGKGRFKLTEASKTQRKTSSGFLEKTAGSEQEAGWPSCWKPFRDQEKDHFERKADLLSLKGIWFFDDVTETQKPPILKPVLLVRRDTREAGTKGLPGGAVAMRRSRLGVLEPWRCTCCSRSYLRWRKRVRNTLAFPPPPPVPMVSPLAEPSQKPADMGLRVSLKGPCTLSGGRAEQRQQGLDLGAHMQTAQRPHLHH